MKLQPPPLFSKSPTPSRAPASRRGALAGRFETLCSAIRISTGIWRRRRRRRRCERCSAIGGRFRWASSSGRSACSTGTGKMHEVTTFRRDVKTDGRHAEVEFGVSLDDDLARRDFTINAIAYSPRLDEIRDPFRGRARSRATSSFARSATRTRGCAKTGCARCARSGLPRDSASRSTRRRVRAIEASAPFLGRLSRERVKQELDKIDGAGALPERRARDLARHGRVPLARSRARRVSARRRSRRPTTSRCRGRARGRRAARIRFAGLMIASTPRDGGGGAHRPARVARRDSAGVDAAGALERGQGTHDRPRSQSRIQPTDAQVRAWVAAIGRLQVGHVHATGVGRVGGGARARRRRAVAASGSRRSTVACCASALRDPIDLGALAVDGDDLRRAGIPPGPALGRILQALLASVIVDPARNTTDWLLQEAQRLERAGQVQPRNAGHTDRR